MRMYIIFILWMLSAIHKQYDYTIMPEGTNLLTVRKEKVETHLMGEIIHLWNRPELSDQKLEPCKGSSR